MQQQSWAEFLLLSSSTPFNLKMTAKRGQQKRPGQQTMKEQGSSKRKSREQEKSKHKHRKNTQTATAESKKRRSWFCSHPLQQRNTIPTFSSSSSTLFFPVLAEMQYLLVLKTPCPFEESKK